jgi:hypothetical protein
MSKTISRLLLLVTLLPVGAACKSKAPATDDAAKKMLSKFLEKGADRAKLSLALKPQDGDYARVFKDKAMAEKAKTVYQGLWKMVKRRPIAPNEGQTELLLWSATTDELKDRKGNASKFPGGYRMAAKHLESGLRVWRFKFVKPGKTLGMAFDGLYNIDGRWVLMPKPWRITR